MMGLLVWSAAATITKSHTQDVLVVNGFDLPVDITLDGKQSTIPPLGHEKITVNTGEVQGRATAHGIVVDTLRQNIDSSGSTTIWNVAGAAPISQKTISYFKTAPETPPSAPEPIMYCGQHYIQIRHVDDTFTPPPRSVRMRRLQQQVDRIHLDLATATGSSGVSTCTDYLFEHDQEGKAAHFLEAQAELNGWDTGNTYMAMIAAALASDANANRIGERAIKARPDDLMLHRHYQLVSDYLGQETPLLQQYAEMARRQPGSASAQYLYAVLLHGPAGLATFKKLAATFGKDTNILKSLAWRRTAHGDYSGAAQAWSALCRISPDDAADVADAQVRALVALGRSKEAVALLTSMLQEGGIGNYAAELLMVLNLNGVDSRRVLENFDKDAKDNPDFDPIRVRGGIEPVGNASAHLPLVKLMLALRNDPATALKTAPALTHADIVQLGSEQWGLLYCEAARVGDEALTMRMDLLTSGTVRAARDILKRFARGEKISLDGADLEPGLRAAAMLVRSRNASLSPEERAEWRQRAAQSDLLHSVVTTALTRWPA